MIHNDYAVWYHVGDFYLVGHCLSRQNSQNNSVNGFKMY